MHTTDLLDKKVRHRNCADKYYLSELDFGFDLNDTQDGLKCWRMGFIFCGKHPLLVIRIQVSDPGPMDRLVLFYLFPF